MSEQSDYDKTRQSNIYTSLRCKIVSMNVFDVVIYFNPYIKWYQYDQNKFLSSSLTGSSTLKLFVPS